MITGLLGKKVGMTQYFTPEGELIPVTVVEAGPVNVIQKKTQENDNYQAVQVGFIEVKKSKIRNITKPLAKHFKDQPPTKHLKEFPVDDISKIEVGQKFDVDIFKVGDYVDVSGTSKGSGFTGVMKRHNFSGGPGSHGHRFNRGTGSIGQSATPSRVFKNKKMSGQDGNQRVTVQGLEIIEINKELNVIMIKGGIPGPNGRLVEVNQSVKIKK